MSGEVEGSVCCVPLRMGRGKRTTRPKAFTAAAPWTQQPGRDLTRKLLYPISTLLHYLHALLTSLLLSVIALGPMPHHIGFVMDGNRRYARSHGQRIARGHEQGSESLKRVDERHGQVDARRCASACDSRSPSCPSTPLRLTTFAGRRKRWIRS